MRRQARGAHASSVCVLLALAAFSFCPRVSYSQTPDPARRMLVEALEAWEAREHQLNPVWVQYDVRVFESSELLTILRLNKGSSRKAPPDRNYEVKAEYARKGEKWRHWSVTTNPEHSHPWQKEGLFLDTGKERVSKSSIPNQFLISKRERTFLTTWVGTPFMMAGEDFVLAMLRNCLGRGEPIVGLKVSRGVDPQGESLVTVDLIHPKTKWRNKCCLIPSRGWAVSYFERYDAAGRLSWREEAAEFGTANGIWYPKRGKQFCLHEQGGKLAASWEFTVSSIEFRASRIPERLFQFDFPADAVIYDADLGVPVRRTEAAQTHLDEVIRRVEPSRTNWLFWGSLVGVGVIAIGGLFWYRRTRKQATN